MQSLVLKYYRVKYLSVLFLYLGNGSICMQIVSFYTVILGCEVLVYFSYNYFITIEKINYFYGNIFI